MQGLIIIIPHDFDTVLILRQGQSLGEEGGGEYALRFSCVKETAFCAACRQRWRNMRQISHRNGADECTVLISCLISCRRPALNDNLFQQWRCAAFFSSCSIIVIRTKQERKSQILPESC